MSYSERLLLFIHSDEEQSLGLDHSPEELFRIGPSRQLPHQIVGYHTTVRELRQPYVYWVHFEPRLF
jgi:hypothetical protein